MASEKEMIVMEDMESPLRRMMADAGSFAYRPLGSFAEAQRDPNGVAVLEGDCGGQIYVVCLASQIKCSEIALLQLLADIDAIEWPHNEPDMRRVYFESRHVGQAIPGGMSGGRVSERPFIHPRLVEKGLSEPIVDVLSGKKTRIV